MHGLSCAPVMRVPAYGKENIPASGIRASLSLTDPVIVPGMSDISPRILCPFCNAITV